MSQGIKMDTIILYHGSPNKIVTPVFGGGDDKHDYGRGFYLTENIDLAKEWAVCRPNEQNGWVHKYELNTRKLKIFDFQEKDVLSWLAELMKHRELLIPSVIGCLQQSLLINMVLLPMHMM